MLHTAGLVWLIPILPLFGFLFHAFLGKAILKALGEERGKWVDGAVATVLVLASFAVSCVVLSDLLSLPVEGRRAFASLIPGADHAPWINIPADPRHLLRVDYMALVDPLSMLMCLIVTGVGGLIHLYATGYMADDRDYTRFFTYFNLFIFFMLMLVLAENILIMFVGWEGVGLCSYLLISFWYEDVENSKAGNKAFIVNRIGDVGFALGIMTVFAVFGTLSFYSPTQTGFLDRAPGISVGLATLIGLLLFSGAVGKSAQFPLYVWLPDAMAGPTPVSALIHAATMVTAGVVMISRVSPIIVRSPVVMTIIACVGVFTAIYAAAIGLTQNDIKKVLAYSTVSQLGYMFLGCGVGAFASGMFHVTTHAFFKALLFLGAGAVIHSLGGEQDMRKMGGLWRKIPITGWTMVFAWLAICGIFPFAGFWSKDEILGKAYAFPYYGLGPLLYAIGLITAIMTAFYMTRLMMKTFWTAQRFNEADLAHHGGHGGGDARAAEEETASGHSTGHHAGVHESPPSMLTPLVILAVLSLIGGWIGIPWFNQFEHYMEPAVAARPGMSELSVGLGMALGLVAGLAGILAAYTLYKQHYATGDLLTAEQKAHNPLYQASVNLFGVDSLFYRVFVTGGGKFATIMWQDIDRAVVDGFFGLLANITGFFSEVFRRVQTGYVRAYAMLMLLGVVAVVIGLLWPVLSR